MGMLQEFKAFAVKGNAVDMAVGVVIGAAFGKIVSSMVEDVIMPPLGMLMGGRDFTNLFITLDGSEFDTLAEAKEAGAAIIGYGSFFQNSINFLIIAMAVFLMVKLMNKMSAAAAAEQAADEKPPETTEDVLLLREIRDSMAASVAKLAETHAAIEAAAAKVPELPEPEPEPEVVEESGEAEAADAAATEGGDTEKKDTPAI